MSARSLDQWLVALSDYLPAAYIAAHSSQLAELFRQGATVGEASTFCRVYLRAPRVEREELTPEESQPFTMLRADSDAVQMARALEMRERMEKDREL